METPQKKVLVVEDDGALRNVLVDSLSKTNFQTSSAGDGEKALAMILEEKPDLVLLDLLIPRLDGFKVLDKIRHYPDAKIANTKVIVLSNLWSDKDILHAQSLQVEEYYVKANTSLVEVFAKIKKILSEP
ncbi:MAG TPA: response regulator [Candidatus Limnocylindria bacterium]|nr:response regulator [Candidatus Limnocylindria bacterium]